MTLALWDGDIMMAYRHEIVGRGHAERLVPELALLPDGGRADRVVVGVGPGSFTGIRVGIAAARALGLAWSVEVVGLSTLGLLAAQDESGSDVIAAIPGGHGEAFLQPFTNYPLTASGDVESLPLGELARRTKGCRLIAPPALDAWVTPDRRGDVDAAAFARVAHLATLPPKPLYARDPDARAPR